MLILLLLKISCYFLMKQWYKFDNTRLREGLKKMYVLFIFNLNKEEIHYLCTE